MVGMPHDFDEDKRDEMIRFPRGPITLPDGRKLLLRVWEPRIAVEEIISVQIEALIQEPDDE